MTFLEFDSLRASHLLARIQSEPEMRADALFERKFEQGLRWSSQPEVEHKEGEASRWDRREQGFSIRLLARDRSWQESSDTLDGSTFDRALRRVARSMSSLPIPNFSVQTGPWPAADPTLETLPKAIEEAVRKRRAAFPFSLELALHQRQVTVVGPTILAEPQHEYFASFRAAAVGQTLGGLLPLSSSAKATNENVDAKQDLPGLSVDDTATISEAIATRLVDRFRSRAALPPSSGHATVILSPHATAIFLHEAVAHALEADILAASGSLEGAIGLRLGSPLLDIIEDPSAAPSSVQRTHDDEGTPTVQRWLLRQGEVCQPIADIAWSEKAALDPGCGRRASRHDLAIPRSSFLKLLPGEAEADAMMAGEGLWVDQIQAGSLQPLTGEVRLKVACGRYFCNGALGERFGAVELRGRVANLLSNVTAVGRDAEAGGAGWCAKDAQRLPVWASAPSIRVENVEIVS